MSANSISAKSVSAKSMPANSMSARPFEAQAAQEESHDVILQVMIPHSLKTEIAVRAARDGETHRTLVLKALRAIGFEVAEAEIADRRKLR